MISIQTGWDRPRKRENNFSPEYRSNPTQARKFPKNSKKIQKIKKTSFWHYFYRNRDEEGREREKKVLVQNPVPTRLGLENSKKIVKKFKKLKNMILTLFLSKLGWDRSKKIENNFSRKFRSYSTQARKFQKKL